MCSSVSEAIEQVLAGVGGAGDEVLALVEMKDRVEAALAERAGEFDACDGWKTDGAYSFPCWLRARADVSRSEARQLAQFAKLVRSMPVVEAAVAEGKLSVAKARLLAGVINDRTRDRFCDHESFLVDQVQGLDVDTAKIVLAHWKRLADSDGPDPGDPTRNEASLTTGMDGRAHFDADLDIVGGAVVKAVLNAIIDRMHQDGRFNDLGDQNTAKRRMADAFVEMAHRASGADPDRPAVHPDIVVSIPVERLTEAEPDPFAPQPELIGTGPISLADAYRLALLGTVSPLTIDDHGRPLNLGRKRRLANNDQWIAVTVRDRECVAPGCDRPAAWCQCHHPNPWAHGGLTDLVNLALTCAHHHHLVHDKGWGLTPQPDGTWTLTRPDGSTVDPPRHPGHQPRARPPD